MNSLIKQIVESKYNFNIDTEDNVLKNSLFKSSFNSKSQKLAYKEYTCIVDLNLPSGTLWHKYNLGCDVEKLTYNIGTIIAEDYYGDYYAWGEIEIKRKYDWTTYKWIDNTIKCTTTLDWFSKAITKYSRKDKTFKLEEKDDAAFQHTNGKSCMPSKFQFNELKRYTSSDWVENYNGVKGLNGRLFTSIFNGNSIFFPAAGAKSDYKSIGRTLDVSSKGLYWSLTLKYEAPYTAHTLGFDKNDASECNIHRSEGCSIRPVLKTE